MDNTTPDTAAAAPPATPAIPAAPVATTAETVLHAAEARIEHAIDAVKKEAPKVESAISAALSAASPTWAKLAARWKTFNHKKKVFASIALAASFVACYFIGFATVYNLLPDHVTHHEVRDVAKSESNAKDVEQLKADIARLENEQKASAQTESDLVETRAVVQALQARIDEMQKAPMPTPPAKSSKLKTGSTHRVPVRKSTSWWSGLVSQ